MTAAQPAASAPAASKPLPGLSPAKTLGGVPKTTRGTPASSPTSTGQPVAVADVESGVVKDKSTGAYAATSPLSTADLAEAAARAPTATGEPDDASTDVQMVQGDAPTDPALGRGTAAARGEASDALVDLAHAKTGTMDTPTPAAEDATPRPSDDSVVDVSVVTIAEPIPGAAQGPDLGSASLPGSDRAASVFDAPPLPKTPLPQTPPRGVPPVADGAADDMPSDQRGGIAALLRSKPAIAAVIGGVVLLVIVIVWVMGGDKQSTRTASSATPDKTESTQRAAKPDHSDSADRAAAGKEPSAAEPSAAEPTTNEPPTPEPTANEPAAPAANEPANEPTANTAGNNEPTASEPAVAAATSNEPTATEPAHSEPAKAVAPAPPQRKPAAKPVKRTATKPIAKPGAKKPATKPATKPAKPAVQKPAEKKWDPNVLFPTKKK